MTASAAWLVLWALVWLLHAPPSEAKPKSKPKPKPKPRSSYQLWIDKYLAMYQEYLRQFHANNGSWLPAYDRILALHREYQVVWANMTQEFQVAIVSQARGGTLAELGQWLDFVSPGGTLMAPKVTAYWGRFVELVRNGSDLQSGLCVHLCPAVQLAHSHFLKFMLLSGHILDVNPNQD